MSKSIQKQYESLRKEFLERWKAIGGGSRRRKERAWKRFLNQGRLGET